jgi:hypothetical protein
MNKFKTHTEELKPIKVKKSGHGRIKLFFSTLIASAILGIIFFIGYGVYSFFTTYGIQSPIVLQSPIYKLNPGVIITPLATQSGKITAVEVDLGKIADKIYTLESSGGKNDSCKEMGLYNGYGFRQNTQEWVCYKSHAEVRQLVINWLLAHLKDQTIEQALCHYNQGTVSSTCTYAMNFKSL